MSQTFSLICKKTKSRVWIGQGWKRMSNFYANDKTVIDGLKKFLNDHKGKIIEFICNDESDFIYKENYTEYADNEG